MTLSSTPGAAPAGTVTTGVITTATPLSRRVRWRVWWRNLRTLWRRSLRFRTILVTLGLTALAVTVACVWMALAIQNELFESRKDQVLRDAQRATVAAQRTIGRVGAG